MDSFQTEVLKTGLKKVFTNRHFSICNVDSCFELAGVDMPGDLRRTLHPLHCVNYSDMPRGMKEELITRILQALADSGVTRDQVFDVVDRVIENGMVRAPRKGLLKLVKGA